MSSDAIPNIQYLIPAFAKDMAGDPPSLKLRRAKQYQIP